MGDAVPVDPAGAFTAPGFFFPENNAAAAIISSGNPQHTTNSSPTPNNAFMSIPLRSYG
jgi:hypothetical protein